jgi:hypothetical protein
VDRRGVNALLRARHWARRCFGAAIGGFIIELAVKTAGEMASFEDAGVSDTAEEEVRY